MRPAPLLFLLLGACRSAPGRPPEPPPASEHALRTPTEVRARSVEIIASESHRAFARLEGVRVDAPAAGKARARGDAAFRLGGLDVRASEEIVVTWLPDHPSFFLIARDVERFRQENVYRHATERAALVSIADDKVTILP
jgi:hypothetical protein